MILSEPRNFNGERCTATNKHWLAIGAVDGVGELRRDDIFGVSPPEVGGNLMGY